MKSRVSKEKFRDNAKEKDKTELKIEKFGTKNDNRSAKRSPILGYRTKRSGVEAVKLHLKTTGGTGRTSRSATSVRKTSIRMTAIKEYPFDLSDLKNQKNEARPPPTEQFGTNQNTLTSATTDGKRKVSIMADEGSKDRENLPSDNLRNGRISAQAEGPSRRKSNLHNAVAAEMDSSWDRPAHIEGRYKKYSTTSSVYSKKALSQQSEHVERSWWYACCQRCHTDDSTIPSWEPPHWQKICPYPLCPSYRRFAQNLAVLLIGIMVWVIVWIVLGDTAAPGGQLFMLAVLTIAAHFGGWLMVKATTLPALIGMLIVGIIMKNIGFVNFDKDYQKIASYVRKIALTIILTRAGLDLDPIAMKKFFWTVIKLALIPWTFEFALSSVMCNLLLGVPWDWAFLLGSIFAAVSPAVIVPCLFRLREKGYGVSKGIPTLVLAVSGIDDAASVAVFGIISSIMFSSSSLTANIIQGPCSIIGGVAFGYFCGYLVKYIPERNDAFLVPLRVLLLLVGGLMSVLGSEEIGWGGAGPLAVIAFGYVACKHWVEQGWDLDDNPAATAFEIFWMFFEPMLFALTGAQIVIGDLDPHLVLIGCGIIITCIVLRAILTSCCAVRSNLNMKEKIFVGLAWMAKATVQFSRYVNSKALQGAADISALALVASEARAYEYISAFRTKRAALAPVALDEVGKMTGDNEHIAVLRNYAEIVITVCIMSIAITAPLGAIVITITGPKLLSKTTKPPVLEGWRRSHRPSIRDISIIDEEEIAERDAEAETQVPDQTHLHSSPTASPIPTTTSNSNSAPNPITVQPNHRT